MNVPEIFTAMADMKWRVSDCPNKILDRTIPDHRGGGQKWRIIVNGNKNPVVDYNVDGTGIEIFPFHVVLYWNGWPAGVVGMNGGTIAHGEGANENDLIASIRASREENK